MEISYEIIAGLIVVGIVFALFGYIFGSLKAINDDIKSILYDRLVIENKGLKSTIENMMQIKNNKKTK